MSENEFSDERLHLFVDDEINTSDRTEIKEAIAHDEQLAARVCELLQLKDTVRLAYREAPRPVNENRRRNGTDSKSASIRAIAAMLVFTAGIATGWLLHSGTNGLLPGQNNGIEHLAAQQQELKRVVIHISSAEQERLDQALTDAEELLELYRERPELVQLEIVANAAGLTLLRTDTSPYPERIRRLAQQFNNVSFLACSRSIEKLHMRGIDVHLLPEAHVIPGALEQIVDRLQDGWMYIRV